MGGGGVVYEMFNGTPKDARWAELRRSFKINNFYICIKCTCLFYSLTEVEYTVLICYKILFNIFLSSASKSFNWALSSRCFHQNPVGTSVPSQENHITLQSHPPRFGPPNIYI